MQMEMIQPNAPTPIMDLYSLVNFIKSNEANTVWVTEFDDGVLSRDKTDEFLLEKQLGNDTYLFKQAFLLWHDEASIAWSLVCLQHEVKKEFDKINNTKNCDHV